LEFLALALLAPVRGGALLLGQNVWLRLGVWVVLLELARV
jgi:hypothetical protein